MTDLDELIGGEAAGTERERLQSVHELLVEAGPPPKLSAKLAAGPTPAMTFGRVRALTSSRRRTLIPAVAAAAIAAVIVGIGINARGTGLTAIPLHGTAAAPHAAATLTVLAPVGEKQPMKIDVHGLSSGRYVVYLVRNSRPWAECGSFTVAASGAETTASLNSPYRLQKGDWWLVTRPDGSAGHGVTVLAPARA